MEYWGTCLVGADGHGVCLFLRWVGPTGQMAFLISRRKISAPIRTQRAATTVDAMMEEAEAMLPRSLAADAVVINASG